MRSAPMRFLNAALWPFTIWTSLTHLNEHAADDYVERTSPIVGSALGFWLCVLGAAAMGWSLQTGSLLMFEVEGEALSLRVFDDSLRVAYNVVLFFVPVIYAIGFWLFTTRDEAYPP